MSKTIAYLRASTDKQDLKNQKLEILEYARKKDLLSYGLSVLKITKVLGYSNHIGLNTYINKRSIKNKITL